MSFDYESRLKKIRILFRRRLDCLLVSGKANIYYLSGFTGGDSWLLITGRRAFLITDPRYREQASEELAPGIEPRMRTPGSLAAAAARLCRDRRLRRMGFEAHRLSYADFVSLKKELRGGEVLPSGPLAENLRTIKDREEINLLRRAGRLTGRLFNLVGKSAGKEMTETVLAAGLAAGLLKRGGEAAFPPIVASGPRSAQPHAVPSGRSLRPADILLVDLGARRDFYNADMTRTFVLETFPRRFRTVYRAVLEAQRRAIDAIKPGVEASFIDGVARDFLARKGYGSFFVHGLGHGVGLEVHERPVLSAGSRDVLEEGMVFTIEPGVYVPGWGGVRIEDTLLLTSGGCEILTDRPRDLDSCCLEEG